MWYSEYLYTYDVILYNPHISPLILFENYLALEAYFIYYALVYII